MLKTADYKMLNSLKKTYYNYFESKGYNSRDVYISTHFLSRIVKRQASLWQLKPLFDKILTVDNKVAQRVSINHQVIAIDYNDTQVRLLTYIDKRFKND